MIIPRVIIDNKSIYATYTVMALSNTHAVLNHIAKSVGLEEAPLEFENMWDHSVIKYIDDVRRNGDKDHTKTETVAEKLFASFPFLRVIAEQQRQRSNAIAKKKPGSEGKNSKTEDLKYEISPEDYYWPLSNALRVLKAYRDACEHTVYEDDKWADGSKFLEYSEQRLPGVMEKYLEVALRNVKERFNYSTDDLKFIQDFRYKNVPVPGQKWPKKVLDHDFFLCMTNENGARNGKLHLSAAGVTLLTCMFLEKQYITIFLSKIQSKLFAGSKPKLTKEQLSVIRRTFGINSIVLPKERIRSDKSGMAIALDMINELKRCPRELFDTLSYADQDAFRVMSDDHQEVLQIRHSDRFVQMMLQYIDYNELFKSVRFGVNMGKLRYLFNAEKHCIDGITRVRVLEQRINAFGRLQELEERRRNDNGCFADTKVKIRDFESVQRDDANAENYPYIVDTYSNYILNDNKIALCFGDQMPEIDKYDDGKWAVGNYIPHCMMSALEVPAMMFHMHLLGEKATERCIRSTYDKYRRLFTAMRDGTLSKANVASFGIAEGDMPQRVLEMLEGNGKAKAFWAKVKKLIDEMMADGDARLKKLKNDKAKVVSGDLKMGKRGFVSIQPGKLADFLAKDIVKFQRTARSGETYGTDRITGLNYRVMQATIATFNNQIEANNRENLNQMFAKAGLTGLNSKTSHPFLYEVLRVPEMGNTIDFYMAYLKKRNAYLRDLKKRIANAQALGDKEQRIKALNEIEITFVNRNSAKWAKCDAEGYKALGEDYLEFHAIELPRHMFDTEIKEQLKKLPQMAGVDFDNANVTYLIAEYLKRVMDDDFQPFYSWKRNYMYMDMLNGKYESNKALAKIYTTMEEREKLWGERQTAGKAYADDKLHKMLRDRNFKNVAPAECEEIVNSRLARSRVEYQKSEKVIRRYKVQDALMFLAAIDEITKNVQFEGKRFKLKAVEPDADKGILSELMPIDFKFELKGKKYTLHADSMKIKNYGDFFKIINDKRLPSLLDIVSEVKVIDKEQLTDEFSNYDNCRPRMVEMILDFEKVVYNRYPELVEKAKNADRFSFSDLMREAVNRGALRGDDRNLVNLIRNSFSHNSYPNPKQVRLTAAALPEVAKKLEEMFSEKARLR